VAALLHDFEQEMLASEFTYKQIQS
jgi:hypothetical protein